LANQLTNIIGQLVNWKIGELLMDDLKIIESCLLGNTQAFSQLIDNYKNMVYNLAYRISNNPHEAEDISQETFLRAYQSLARFNPSYKFSTWLYQITLNIIRDRFKKKELNYVSLDTPVETDDSELYPQPADLTNNPEQIMAQKEDAQAIQQAIYSLPLKYKEVLVLRHLQDLSYIEISNILKLPAGTVKVRLYRAREQLRKILLNSR
jgi:RNA polymerase sigma-70 factor (ECF subfamily)